MPTGIGHWALGIGHWALGIGHRALGIGHTSPRLRTAIVRSNVTEQRDAIAKILPLLKDYKVVVISFPVGGE